MPINYTDKSVPVAVAIGLRQHGIAAISARDVGNLGIRDDEQFAYAIANHLVLFTHDTDFIELARGYSISMQEHCGPIYVHQKKLSVGECIRRLSELAGQFEQDDFKNYIGYL